MRRLFLAAALLSLTAGAALAADPAEGVWLVQDKNAKVRIAPCPGRADQLCGEIVWLQRPLGQDDQPRRDEHNPDPALRSRPVVGLMMIRDFSVAAPGRWEGGKIYDPKAGKTYASKMRVTPEGALKIDGCVLMLCKTQTWTRAGGSPAAAQGGGLSPLARASQRGRTWAPPPSPMQKSVVRPDGVSNA